MQIALMNCILFMMVDVMRGNFETAVLHLHNGMEILGRWQRENPNDIPRAEGSVQANLIQVFHQLGFKTSPEAYSFTPFSFEDLEYPTTSDLAEARRAIDDLTKEGLRLIRLGAVITFEAQPQGQQNSNSWSLAREVSTQRARLSHWSYKFESLASRTVSSTTQALSIEKDEEISELRIMHLSALI
jgi:hypothetical protein